jgi:hypothetical protein
MTRYDHGCPVDVGRLCAATTKRGRPCRNPALVGLDLCAYHGRQVAERARWSAEVLNGARPQLHADPRALERR